MKTKLQGCKIGILMGAAVLSTFAGAAITDIEPKHIKGAQLLMSRTDVPVPLEEADLIVFQRVSNCNPEHPVMLFGLKGHLTDDQKLRRRFCEAIRKALTTQEGHGSESAPPPALLVSDADPLASVWGSYQLARARTASKRYAYLVDWNAAYMDARYFHLVFEVALLDTETQRWLWHSMHSQYSIDAHSYGEPLVEVARSLVKRLRREVGPRAVSLDFKYPGARLLSGEEVPSQGSGELLFINHYSDGGYNTYPDFLRVNRLPDAAAEPPSKSDFYLQVPKHSYAKVQLEPGFYTVGANGGSVYRFEISAGAQHAVELTRGLFNRSSISEVNAQDLPALMAKHRNGFFPEPPKQSAFTSRATWQAE